MQVLTRLPQLCGRSLMMTSVCHNGGGRSGILGGRSWAFEPPDACGRRCFGVLCSQVQSKLFRNGSFPPAVLGNHRAFCNIFVSHFQDAQVSNFRRLLMKGNLHVTAYSTAERSSEETSKEDFASFRPPPPAPPITPEDLRLEVPFQYWYSYADIPDNSTRKKKRRPRKLEEPKESVTTELRDISDSLSIQPQEATEISDLSVPEEPRRSLMRETRKHAGSSSQKQDEPRRSLMRESRQSAGSSLNSEELRSRMRERRVASGLFSPRRGRGNATIDSSLQSSGERARDGCSDTVEIEERAGLLLEEDGIARLNSAKKLEERNYSARDPGEKLEEEQESVTCVGSTECTGLVKEAFRLSKKEINLLVDKCNRSNRQINMGWRGWGHNYITLIHSYWRTSEVCKIKCKGAVTLGMDFLCNKLEEKTGGRVIHRNIAVVYLYRGRDYDPKFARKLPVMHQRKRTPAKRLPIPFGLTKDDVNALRARGKELPALCKLAKNGVFVTLLDDIRKAFEKSDLVRVNCQGFEARNFRALGVKLKKLVPCILISYEFEHILMWRWDGYKVLSPEEGSVLAEECFKDDEEDVEE